MYLFFDTETTGIPANYRAPASDSKNWPRLVQVGWLLTDETAKQIESTEYIIKPDGYTIPQDAAKIHGITTEIALKNGSKLRNILRILKEKIEFADVLVAHNMQFDEKILGAEFLRCGFPNIIETKPRICTMLASTDFCQISGPYGYKWPSLQTLYRKLFKRPIPGAHTALVDTQACAAFLFYLKRLRVIV
ncbi:MAG: 3'-5' exonuclease [Chloroflexota bacterium]